VCPGTPAALKRDTRDSVGSIVRPTRIQLREGGREEEAEKDGYRGENTPGERDLVLGGDLEGEKSLR